MSRETILKKGENRITIDLNNLRAGVYFLQVNDEFINAQEKNKSCKGTFCKHLIVLNLITLLTNYKKAAMKMFIPAFLNDNIEFAGYLLTIK